MNNEDYVKRGRNALAYFHNRALKYPDYNLSLDQLVNILNSRSKNFVQGLGDGIILVDASEKNIKAGMELLADRGKGKIPATNASFTQAIASNIADNISYVDALSYTAVESGKQIASGVSEGLETVGNSVIQGLKVTKFLTEYWYITIPVAIYGYLMLNQFVRAKLK